MKIQLIRNATMRISYHGLSILTDPVLGPKFSIESFLGISDNPLVDLPMLPQEVIENINVVLLSHLHVDHFDLMAQRMLNKQTPIYCQQGDEERLRAYDFTQVHSIHSETFLNGIQIIRIPGKHGSGVWAEKMGPVSGYILKAKNAPTLYWLGDTILHEGIFEAIRTHKPDVVITHSSGAAFETGQPILMDDVQTVELLEFAPKLKCVAIHMDSLDHGKVDRAGLRTFAKRRGYGSERLLIPEDGEVIEFNER